MATSSTTSPSTASAAPKKKAYLTVGMMAVMIITGVLSMRGLASQAEFGLSSIFYYVFAAIVFLIPYSLVCAELASAYTKCGGLFRWVSEAFGGKWGWSAMYLEWQTVMIWFPSVLLFAAVSLAYIWWPESFDASLASNKVYSIIVVLAVYWLATLNSFRGLKSANKLSSVGGMCGTIIPGAILILLGIVYLILGKPIMMTQPYTFWPDFTKFSTIVLAASIFLFYGGMEMQAVHITDMPNPSKSFPKAVFMAVVGILVIFILATLAIAIAVPQKDINLLQGLLVAYNTMWGALGVKWIGNIMAVLITFGVIGQASAIMAGPSTGILAVGRAGFLPRGLQKVNKHGVQVPILLIQGAFVTILAFIVVLLPSVQSAYQLMSQMATVIYLIMVVIIYLAFIWLRHTAPNKKRGFKVPGGSFVAWLVTIVGVLGSVVAMVLSFVPPSQINTGSPVVYVGILLIGVVLFFSVPFIVYRFHKKDWVNPNEDFAPFDWQIEGRKPSQVSKWPAGYEPTQAEINAARQKYYGEKAIETEPAK